MKKDDEKLIAEARKRWARCHEAEIAQRRRIIDAKKFRSGDQWPDDIKRARQGAQSIAGMMPAPARPCLVVDRLSQPFRQALNTIIQAEFGFDVSPNGSGASDDVAEMFRGYLRHVQAVSRAESPIEWAASGAIEGGIGWFRMRTDYVYETWDGAPDDPAIFDQEIKLERIVNNLSVYCDPSASKPTRSDAQFMFVTEDVDKEEFKRRWPDADYTSLDQMDGTGDGQHWVDKDSYRVGEYWRIIYQDKQYAIEGKTRTIRVPIVKMDIITGVQSLQKFDWPGSHIPIVPVLGEELNIDGKVHLRGIIEEGMDPQRMVNYTYSGAIEIYALGNKSPYIIEEQQIASYQDYWATANTVNHSFLPYKGGLAPPPARDVSEAPIQAAVELMRTSEDAIKATTGVPDAALGNVSPTAHSGKAIQSLQAQSDLANGHWADSVKRALIYAGELMVEVIPKITRPGQILHIIGMDDETEQVMVGKPFVQGPGGVPQEVDGVDENDLAKFFDLSQGRYGVTVTFGKANATKREEGAAAIGDLIPHLPPEMAAVATVEYIKTLSFPGSQGFASKIEKALPPGLQEPPEGGLPPQITAQMQALQAQNQQLQQAVQEDQAKQQAMLQKAQLDSQTSMQTAQLEAETKLKIAGIVAQTGLVEAEIKAASADKDRRIAQLEVQIGVEKELRLEASEHIKQARDHAHEVGITAMEQAHEKEMHDKQAALATAQQGAQQSHESDLATQAQESAAATAE